MAFALTDYDRFLQALKSAKLAFNPLHTTREQVLSYRLSLLQEIIKELAYIQDFSAISLGSVTLEAILTKVKSITRPTIVPIVPRTGSMSRRIAIPLIIEGVYRDIDEYARDPEVKEREINILWKQLFGKSKHPPAWYQMGYNILGKTAMEYLLRSRTFLAAGVDLKSSDFRITLGILTENKASLMVFAKVRSPAFSKTHTKDGQPNDDKFRGVTRKDDVHYYVVPSKGYTIAPTLATTISENIFEEEQFYCVQQPSSWPENLDWPSHPGRRHEGTRCGVCKLMTICDCKPPSPTSGKVLTEVYDYGNLGRGIRSLQRIRTGAVLGEYVGRLHHANANIDTTFAVHFSNPSGNDPEEPIALVDSSTEGNWTRFINHTCGNPNVGFQLMEIGQYRRIIIRALRDIRLYDQLLINYGEEYWETRTCLCGASNCCAPPSRTAKPIQASVPSTKQKSWIMTEQYHSDSSNSDNRPRRKKIKAARNAKALNLLKNKKLAQRLRRGRIESGSDADDEMEPRVKEAYKRVARARELKREKTIWNTRWIGQENGENPRNKGNRSGDGYFKDF